MALTQSTVKNNTTFPLLTRADQSVIIRDHNSEAYTETSTNFILKTCYKQSQGEIFFMGCLDRTLHWFKTYPDELKKVLADGLPPGIDSLVIGRITRALDTHPVLQLKAEIATNQITAALLDIKDNVDVAIGCRLISKKTAQAYLDLLTQKHCFFNPGTGVSDSLIPFLVQEGLHKKIDFIRVEGLELETPDQ